jgi:hypothetical protein
MDGLAARVGGSQGAAHRLIGRLSGKYQSRSKIGGIVHGERDCHCHEVTCTLIGYEWSMTGVTTLANRTQFDPLGAGALLAGVLAVCLGIGALIGLAAGSAGIGVGIGALVGVPASVAAVIARYRGV